MKPISNRVNKNNNPVKKNSKHVSNFYRTIKDIADDFNCMNLDPIRFVLFITVGNENKKKKIEFRENGLYDLEENKIIEDAQAKDFIMRNEGIFKKILSESLEKHNLLKKYLPVITLSNIADRVELLNKPIFFYSQRNGINIKYAIFPNGNEGSKFFKCDKTINLTEARNLFIKYYYEFLFQIKQAFDNAEMKESMGNGNAESNFIKNKKSELGIKSVKKGNRTIIDSGSILNKNKSKNVSKEEEERIRLYAKIAKEAIFGKNKGYLIKK